MCGKHWGYKSFVFVSAVTKGLTGDYFASAASTGLSRKDGHSVAEARSREREEGSKVAVDAWREHGEW
jgi:hypothetical protein